MKTELELRQNPNFVSSSVSLYHFRASCLGSKPLSSGLDPRRLWSAFIGKRNTRVSCRRQTARCTCTQAHRSAAVGDCSGLGVQGDNVTVAAWDPGRATAVRLSKTISLFLRQAKPRLRHHHKCVPNCRRPVFHFSNLSVLPLCLSSHSFPPGFAKNSYFPIPFIPSRQTHPV
jgi:hypothetical protein